MSKPGEWISLHFWVTPTHTWIEFDTNRHDSWLIVFNIMKRNNDERNTEKQQLSATVEVTCTELQASWKKSWLQVVFLFSWSLFWQTSLLSVTMKTERITDTTWWALPSSWASLKEFKRNFTDIFDLIRFKWDIIGFIWRLSCCKQYNTIILY